MSDSVYIGRVERVIYNSEKNYRFARVEPIIMSSDDQETWIGPIEDASIDFPSCGLVYWHNAPLGLTERELKQFEIDIHPTYEGEPERDKYQVKNPKDIIEIVDLRHIGSERKIRKLLQKEGVNLKGGILGKRCILWTEDDRWVGEICLVRVGNSNNWIFEPEQDLISLRCRQIPVETIQRVEFDGTRYFLKPKYGNLGKHVGFVNWEPNKALARRVFKHLLKRDREAAKALDVTKEVFRKYIDTVENAGLFDQQLEHELAFRQRVEEILETITNNEDLLDEAAKVCCEEESVKCKVEDQVEQECQRLIVEQKKRLRDEFSNEKDELEKVKQKLLERKKALSSIEEQIEAIETKLEEQIGGYETELMNRLLELSKKPERMFAEMSIIKALTHQRRDAPMISVESRIKSPNVPVANDADMFFKSFCKHLLKDGVSLEIGKALHSSFLAGQTPVLIGPQAYETILAYSNCVSGGVLHWIPIGGNILEPSDILARYDPDSRGLLPQPGGLLDLLLDQSENINIVVFDGFNRAAVDGYLIPLLQSLQDTVRGRPQRHIPLAPTNLFYDTNPYQKVSNVAWNRNVLLVLCPSNGSASLPIPKEIWGHCAAIDTWDTVPKDIFGEQMLDLQTTKVQKDIWENWKTRANETDDLEKIPSTLPDGAGTFPPLVFENYLIVTRAGISIGMEMDEASRQAFRLSLCPYLVAAEEDMEIWYDHFDINMDSVDRRISDDIRNMGE